MRSFRYRHNETVSADDIRVEFTNDRWDPAAGIDSNLTVDFISIDGDTFETEDPSVFSTGTWKVEDGIEPGNRESETLHTNGYFQYTSTSGDESGDYGLSAVDPFQIDSAEKGLELHIQKFATVLGPAGEVLRLNTMVSTDSDLYASSEEGYVHKLTDGQTELAFNFRSAWPRATGRSMDFGGWHGGLRGIAFSPNFEVDGKIYTAAMEKRPSNPSAHHYISDAAKPIAADSVVSEWTIVNGKLDTGSYRELFRVGMPVYDHPIKDLAFGPDGMLYITHGDGSVQSATAGGGQNNDALGKILRIDPTPSNGLQYTIPDDNPFVGDSGMIDEAWSIGHRNPHTLSFSDDGTLIVGEVGRDNIDEINVIEKGHNYGWPAREGTYVHLASGGLVNGISGLPANDQNNDFTYPVAQFAHKGPVGAGFVGQAIAGGHVVENGSPASGEYFYAEFASIGNVYHLTVNELNAAVTNGSPDQLTQLVPGRATLLFDHDNDPATDAIPKTSLIDIVNDSPNWTGSNRSDARFGRGPDGELYFSSKRNGEIYLVTSSLPGGPGGFRGDGLIQAETGAPTGTAGIATEHSGYTGTGFIDDILSSGSGVKGLNFAADTAGTHRLDVRYSAGPYGPSGTRSLGVYVNGVRQAQLRFDNTGAWNRWSNSEVNVELAAGVNTIDLLVGSGDNGHVNLGTVSLTKAT